MRNIGISEAFIRAAMNRHKGVMTEVKVGDNLSEEFEANVGVHQGTVLLPLLFAIVIGLVTNEIKVNMLQEILYADNIVKVAKTLVELQEKFYSLKSALEIEGQKENLVKTKVIVSKIGHKKL